MYFATIGCMNLIQRATRKPEIHPIRIAHVGDRKGEKGVPRDMPPLTDPRSTLSRGRSPSYMPRKLYNTEKRFRKMLAGTHGEGAEIGHAGAAHEREEGVQNNALPHFSGSKEAVVSGKGNPHPHAAPERVPVGDGS